MRCRTSAQHSSMHAHFKPKISPGLIPARTANFTISSSRRLRAEKHVESPSRARSEQQCRWVFVDEAFRACQLEDLSQIPTEVIHCAERQTVFRFPIQK